MSSGPPSIRTCKRWSTSPPWRPTRAKPRGCLLPRSLTPRCARTQARRSRLDLAAGQRLCQAFAQQGTAEEHAVLAAVHRPIAVQSIQQPVSRPGWKDHPSWFLIAEEDRMINPITQKFMAERMGANVHSHDADHAPLVTRPQAVVDIISEAVNGSQ
ncbi:MAG: alpha/beta fold hydrolase [Mycobacterium sp.]